VNGYYAPIIPPENVNARASVNRFAQPPKNAPQDVLARFQHQVTASRERVRPYGLGDNAVNYHRWMERYEVDREAVNLIAGNPYYGYKKYLVEAAPTRYKSLGWVAKELLVCGAGKSTLVNYAGWPRSVPNMERVRAITSNYPRQKGEVAEMDQGDVNIVHDIMRRLIVNYNAQAMEAIWRGERRGGTRINSHCEETTPYNQI
jgi:hypothetical protein